MGEPPLTPGAIRALSVAKLRDMCAAEGIGVGSFVDKRDFVDALLPKFKAPVSGEAFAENMRSCRGAQRCWPLCFLDVDGVLNHSSTFKPQAEVQLELACVFRLVRLVERTDARLVRARWVGSQNRPICFAMASSSEVMSRVSCASCGGQVLSTSWRSSEELKADLWSALVDAGMRVDRIVGQTPHIGFKQRAQEIEEWLESHSESARAAGWSGAWVALDDMELAELCGHEIWVDPEFGLEDDAVMRAENILGAAIH
jgi:hypothetical protein